MQPLDSKRQTKILLTLTSCRLDSQDCGRRDSHGCLDGRDHLNGRGHRDGRGHRNGRGRLDDCGHQNNRSRLDSCDRLDRADRRCEP